MDLLIALLGRAPGGRGEQGQTTTEYALVVAMVIVLAGLSFAFLQGPLTDVVNGIGTKLAAIG